MSRAKQVFVFIACIFYVFSANHISLKAQNYITIQSASHTSTYSIQTEDIILVKHRKYNGKLQYRRWNETKHYWIDPAWIDVV